MTLNDPFWALAEHFMEVIASETGLPVFVCDHEGRIVRATDRSRLGNFHAGAQKILQGLVDEYGVTPEEAAANPSVREGYNCPIVMDGRRVATFGLTGKLEQTRPLAKIAVRLIDSWIADQRHKDQLARSERKYRSIVDHSPQGIFQSTLDGRLLTANPALARMYGYPSPDALLAAITDIPRQLYVSPEDRERFLAGLEREGRVTGFETRYRRRDGREIDVRVNAHFVSDPETGARVIEGIVQDITARRQAREALRLSEEKYAKAFNSIPNWVVLSELATGRYIEVNDTFLHTTGYARTEVIGRTSMDIDSWVNPEDRQVILDAIQAHGRIRNFEVRRRVRSGRTLAMLFSAEVIEIAGKACMLSVSQDISERKQAEEDLHRSENHLRITLDSIGDAVIATDTAGAITRLNPMAEKLTGWTAAEAVGRPLPEVFRIVNAFSREPVENPAARVLESGELVGLANHTVLVARDGREHHIGDSAAPIREENGRVEGVVLVFRDVTALQAAQEEIRQRRQFLELVLSHAPDAIVTLDAAHRVIDWNPGAERIFGYTPAEAYGRPLDELVARDEVLAEAGRKTRQVLSGSRVEPFETIRFHRDGTPRQVIAAGSPILADGVLKGVVAVYTDITARKEAEARLAEAHERFLTVLDSIDATIYVADMQTHEVLYMNAQMKKAFGGDFTGRRCWESFRQGDGPCPDCTSGNLLDDQGQPSGVCVWEARNPLNRRWYVNYDRAIRWVDGRLVRLQVATDITEQKALEQERQSYEARIQQMQKMEAIGTLAGGIAHDFNNILSAVIGYAELALIDTIEDPQVQHHLRQIQAAGLRARDLVQQILTFSRQEEKELRPLQIGLQVKEALKMLRSSLPSTIEIEPRIDSGVDPVLADPTQIHQIVMNLCANAAQAMEEAGGVLTVGLSQERLDAEEARRLADLGAGEYACLSVEDTGGGIPPELQDKIFQPYFTTKEKGKGTGLGLAVVHGIVQSYGGGIRLESAPGRGARFAIYLPTIKAPAEAPPRPSSLPTGRERVLFVDDEAAIVELGRQGLQRLGYRVDGCTGCLEALERFREDPSRYDLVISDMTMPKMTGDQLAREFLRLRPGIPIILTTGYSSRIDPEQARGMGIGALLMKPLNLAELAVRIRQVLDGSKPHP